MRVKKGFCAVIAALLFVVAIGTVSAGGKSDNSASRQLTDKTNPNIPWFYNLPEDPDYIYAVGIAKMQSPEKSRRVAMFRARIDLAFQINSYFSSSITATYGLEVGTIDNTADVERIEIIDTLWASASLRGSEVVENFAAPDGTHWVLVRYPINVVDNAASKTAVIQANDAVFEYEKSTSQPVATPNRELGRIRIISDFAGFVLIEDYDSEEYEFEEIKAGKEINFIVSAGKKQVAIETPDEIVSVIYPVVVYQDEITSVLCSKTPYGGINFYWKKPNGEMVRYWREEP